ncbi:hypothetical protein SAMN05216210_3410 [Halopseudomonas salegens]|uniref:Uncharacterized protein n=1 Tax=Halopseudomonas salegens TaxID=1434072 RepID=A0A1H2HZ95_9GAMM|nr:hypothetical protein SAMN05216210_3410 [Halopseudomonas salegens]
MNKITAHLVLGLFDVAAVAACVYVFSSWTNIDGQLSQNVDSLSVSSNLNLAGLMVIVPVTHSMALFNWKESIQKWGNRCLIGLFLFLLVGAFIMDSYLESKILAAGYEYCAGQSEKMTFSEYRTYVGENRACLK